MKAAGAVLCVLYCVGLIAWLVRIDGWKSAALTTGVALMVMLLATAVVVGVLA